MVAYWRWRRHDSGGVAMTSLAYGGVCSCWQRMAWRRLNGGGGNNMT